MKSDNEDINSYSSGFRAKRVKQLIALLEKKDLKEISILDVGGTINYWEMNLKYFPQGLIAEIDVINLHHKEQTEINIGETKIRSGSHWARRRQFYLSHEAFRSSGF